MKKENNIKALQIYKANWDIASEFDLEIGKIIHVDITDIFPNLANDEFDCVNENYIVTSEPIDVFIHPHHDKLIISDGHHRFASALKNGEKSMKCKIVECISYNLYIPTEWF